MTYSSEVLADSPDVYYRLDETGSGPFVDIANGHNATPSASITTAPSLLVSDSDSAAVFSATFNAPTATYNGAWATSMTAELWWNPNALATDQCFIQSTVSGFAGYTAQYIRASGKYQWTSHGAANFLFNATPATIGVTTYVAFVLTAGAGVDLYLNGVFQQNVAGANGVVPTQGLFLGHNAPTLSPTATVDEIAIYKTALSAGRIAAHYAAGITQAGARVVAGWGITSGGR